MDETKVREILKKFYNSMTTADIGHEKMEDWVEDKQRAIKTAVSALSTAAQEAIREAYVEGRKEGIRDYAWMKDGVTYVGTTGTKLKQAIERLTKESE